MDKNFITIVNQVIILSIIMIVGFYARKKKILDSNVNKNLSELLLRITLPLLIISSFNFDFSKEMLNQAGMIFFYSIIIHIILIFISKIVYRRFPLDKKRVLKFITVFSNCGFMGYPVLEGLYGKIGIFYAAIFGVAFNIFTLSFGIMFFTDKKDVNALKELITHPGIIAVIIGFILFLFSIKLPFPITNAMNLIGSMTTPLSMIIVGSMLAESNVNEVFTEFSIYFVSLVRLIAAPLLTYILLSILNADTLLLQICVILEAMPGAAVTAVFAEKYNGDSIFASKCIFITTLLSVFTIPIIVLLIM